MAAFSSSSFHHHPFSNIDSSSLFLQANTPSTINNKTVMEEPNDHAPITNCFSHQFPLQLPENLHINLDHITTNNPITNTIINVSEANSVVSTVANKNNCSMDSSSIVTDYKYEGYSDQAVTQKGVATPNMEKKRKCKEGSSPNSAQSKDNREVKGGKKHKKVKDGEEKKAAAAEEAAPVGYIHVRARRGQATDSHSLAERVRRERISERMKLLQALVPGCDRVTGKALMLDEIINYVQSLQNQVEFLSMKLASLNPMLYDFGMDLEAFMVRPHDQMDLSNLPSPLPSMQECSPTTANDYHLLQNAATSMLFQQPQFSPNVPIQGRRQALWEVDDHRQKTINQSGGFVNSLFSFH